VGARAASADVRVVRDSPDELRIELNPPGDSGENNILSLGAGPK
jgi:hypothetical protein